MTVLHTLIELTLLDGTKVLVSPRHILHIHLVVDEAGNPSGSNVEFITGETLRITEHPEAISEIANTQYYPT